MSESIFSISHDEEGHIVLGVTPAPGEEIAVGRLVDCLTPTPEYDHLRVAQPDESGEIRRTLAPDVTTLHLEFILEAAGFKQAS